MRIKILLAGFIVANLALYCACSSTHFKPESVELAMKKYDHLILKLDADSIALLFTPDGNLGNMAKGRAEIKKFLSSFKNIKVLSQISKTTSIEMAGDSAVQKGNYQQMDVVSDKDTLKVKGEYVASWQWIPQEGWRIKRMITKPIN